MAAGAAAGAVTAGDGVLGQGLSLGLGLGLGLVSAGAYPPASYSPLAYAYPAYQYSLSMGSHITLDSLCICPCLRR